MIVKYIKNSGLKPQLVSTGTHILVKIGGFVWMFENPENPLPSSDVGSIDIDININSTEDIFNAIYTDNLIEKYNHSGLTPQEAALVDFRKLSAEECSRIFKVPNGIYDMEQRIMADLQADISADIKSKLEND